MYEIMPRTINEINVKIEITTIFDLSENFTKKMEDNNIDKKLES